MTNNETESTLPPEAAVETPIDLGTFADLGLGSEVLRALADMGFTAPMEVQRQTAPVVMSGRDVLVQSRTGSGKTAAFGIPLIDRMVKPEQKAVQAIVMLPTRELALQVAAEMARIAAYRDLTVVPVYGGAPMGKQVEQLRAGGQIVCGTPGRIQDHLRRGTLKLDQVRCAVLDECDEMLSMGFQEDIERILEHTPSTRQTMLFSATMPDAIKRLARRYLKNPVHLKLSPDSISAAEISHLYYAVNGTQREADLLRILAFENPGRGIVFCNTREETGRVAEFLRSQGMDAEAISSDLSQSDREKVMIRMREGSIRFLVATDVAARGIDIDDISHVFNFSFPDSPESYIHRTGRTGRAGRTGVAVSLIGPTEVGSFYYLKLLYKIKPEERTLPSESEIQARREGESLVALRKQLSAEPGGQWRALARRVLTGLDSEHLIAALLKEKLSTPKAKGPQPTRSVLDTTEDGETSSTAAERPRDRDAERNYRDRPARGPADRGERDRGRGRFERGDRTQRSEAASPRENNPSFANGFPAGTPSYESAKPSLAEAPAVATERTEVATSAELPAVRATVPERRPDERAFPISDNASRAAQPRGRSEGDVSRGERPIRNERFRDERPSRPQAPRSEVTRNASSENRERPPARASDDFSAVWQDPPSGDEPASSEGRPQNNRAAAAGASTGSETRLYLNLGRKDRVRTEDVVALLIEAGTPVAREAVEVMSTHSYINVDEGRAQELVSALNGREHNGRSLICEVAKPRRERY